MKEQYGFIIILLSCLTFEMRNEFESELAEGWITSLWLDLVKYV